MIIRDLQKAIIDQLETSPELVIILGARQVGKTTLLRVIQNYWGIKKLARSLYLNCDVEEDWRAINTRSLTKLKSLLNNTDLLLIDEAQRLDNAGLTAKIIYDNFQSTKIVLTGSSSFEVKNKLSDTLAGRYVDFVLPPLSINEVLNATTNGSPLIDTQIVNLLENVMIFGGYPNIHLEPNPTQKINRLNKIVESYLFKDILSLSDIRNSRLVQDLATSLAYQIGAEVSETELANRLGVDRKTVGRYLDLLEQSFVITRLRPFHSNPRREIGKSNKVFFNDLGIRNLLIGDFNELKVRGDVGALWENFLFIERQKLLGRQKLPVQINFWRSYSGAEIDYLEKQINQPLRAYEFKWTKKAIGEGAKSFADEHSIDVKLINRENFFEFVTLTDKPKSLS